MFVSVIFFLTDRDDLLDRDQVEKFQEVVLEALELEVRHNHANNPLVLPRLLGRLVDLRQLKLEHIKQIQRLMLMETPSYGGPTPLMREVYGL